MSVDKLASKFLDNYLSLKRSFEPKLSPEPEPEHSFVSNLCEEVANVIITRVKEPRFFAGQKRNGDFVWSHDMRFAKRVSEDLIHIYEEKLGETLLPLWPYAR
jgi:hypothetical protein